MKKGVDYIGLTVCFYCHDGAGNYLFHKRSDQCRDEVGCWDTGGGSVHVGETIEEALHREVQEEYGVAVLHFEELGHSDILREQNGVMAHWHGFRFKVLVDREQVVNNEPHKHTELGWFTLDNLPTPLHSQIPKELEWYKEKL
jgi:8-oxo-dGTP pyrophosphatase MutT (NUDIX family)